ncbi:gamma-glutamyl-gamma-aminobutyrate hydrolase family protein [Alkalibaculum sp. M08DMB]|uniref:Gamma-glutamyl-gamma-aminobutyrate hydrolase family protein n=1 Tax=Alkalibaculum sporogenes TaxID=2655001 RepID=A0A6A7K5U9_9FIRM|nr:gamma-glutamyl-gamma-aminobutyrate hydrolase family protein [Alkalibaculum sporogenes]MPW24859.1 gamma-glutamyl-gamma-aminobutyrate hydrolase family protein [Alkalibaculum sporogenes]
MKPIVGIICSYSGSLFKGNDGNFNYNDEDYIIKVKQAGAIPFLIPVRPSFEEDIPNIMNRLDGIILSGGVDVHPSFYNEEPKIKLGYVDQIRDKFEISLAKHCINKKIPILGICRGMQLLNVVEGGSLYQDINSELPDSVQHTQKTYDRVGNHYIKIEENNFLRDIYGDKGFVNSFHHQAIKKISPNFQAIAWSTDGLVEAMIHKENSNIIAIQWHPELLEEVQSLNIFKYFTTLMSS